MAWTAEESKQYLETYGVDAKDVEPIFVTNFFSYFGDPPQTGEDKIAFGNGFIIGMYVGRTNKL